MLKVESPVFLSDEALSSVQLEDRISVPTERKMTDAGQMHVPCKFARTGSQLYTAKQLGLVDEDPSKVVEVWRDEAEVFAEDSMESFRSAPVTIGHPVNDEGASIAVSSENSKELQVGMLEGMPSRDEDTLGGVLVLTAQEAIDALEDGTQELSAGYTCDIALADDGKMYQRNIRANHIAIVAKGRAGSSCRISDEAIEVADEDTLKSVEVELAAEVETQVVTTDAIVAKENELVDAKEALEVALADAAAQVTLVDELKADAVAQLVVIDELKAELADAKVAAEQGVVERTNAIANARLISDIRLEDLGDKSVEQIERMVVEDQMPERDLSTKEAPYISAMFDLLIDASKGETPMGKILSNQDLSDTVTLAAKKVSIVEKARQESIARNKS